MSTDLSNITQIVDASAAIAAAYVAGIRSAYGIGAGSFTIPVGGTWDSIAQDWVPPGGVLAGTVVRPWPGNIAEDFTHVSDMPAAPKITYHSAGVTNLQWHIPMRLYISKGSQDTARLVASPFYARYLLAFAKHAMILGTCNSAEISDFALFHDIDQTGFVGVSMILTAWERLDMEMEP